MRSGQNVCKRYLRFATNTSGGDQLHCGYGPPVRTPLPPLTALGRAARPHRRYRFWTHHDPAFAVPGPREKPPRTRPPHWGRACPQRLGPRGCRSRGRPSRLHAVPRPGFYPAPTPEGYAVAPHHEPIPCRLRVSPPVKALAPGAALVVTPKAACPALTRARRPSSGSRSSGIVTMPAMPWPLRRAHTL